MKKFSLKICLLLVWIITASNSCKKDSHNEDALTTINNAAHPVFALLAFDYPDTSLQHGGCISCFVQIEPGESYQHFYYPNNKYGWESRIRELNPNHTLTMFFLHPDTLKKYSFEGLQSNYNILDRYELSVDQLKAQNWEVRYP